MPPKPPWLCPKTCVLPSEPPRPCVSSFEPEPSVKAGVVTVIARPVTSMGTATDADESRPVTLASLIPAEAACVSHG